MTDTCTSLDGEVARARGAAYGLIGHGFRDPEHVWASTLGDASCWSSWPDVLSRVDADAARLLQDVRLKLQVVVCATAFEQCRPSSDVHCWHSSGTPARELVELREAFVELFGHTVRGKCPPYELEYEQGEIMQRAADLADVSGFYTAFGLDVFGLRGERPDHLSVECEFMSVLCAKEDHGIETGPEELLDTCRKAQRDFLRDHLARWLPAFANRVIEASGGSARSAHGFYNAMARFADAFVSGECRRLKIRRGPKLLELRSADPTSEAEVGCGTTDPSLPGTGPQFTHLNVNAPAR